ncbi:MAG: hypothetical protein QM831_41950 [Kofleriaceae bacterium]
MKWLLVVLFACACPKKDAATPPPPPPPTQGSASVGIAPIDAKTCDDVKPRVEALYRAEAQQKEPTRVEEAVSDNTTMVMNDCKQKPDLVVCLAKVATVPELEKTCLIPLDDEGTENK